MQSQIAQARTTSLPALTRRWKFSHGALGLGGILALLVSFGVFRGLLLQGGEEDARVAMRWMAREIQQSEDWPSTTLAAWMQPKALLLHRLGDARFEGEAVLYHGYRFTWQPNGRGGTLHAQPTRPGVTGDTPYRLNLQR
ncbi:MAG: hypothetical protein H6830_04125 [Planctomycetes bacterium]|nr:hypothetical protein [Planctomycetota bacterium]MCB9910425.1 hypothetical protein [Planctomycetota bacterium]MCB9912551.1 hypothetical protein [Planctomycetota bacterium]HPF15449.1 hypothetical protein [Planctomycetota bacterium]HRV83103.1 hypothetical protein [Planctomycetota bacterium]